MTNNPEAQAAQHGFKLRTVSFIDSRSSRAENSAVPAEAGTRGPPQCRIIVEVAPLLVVLLDQFQFPGAPQSLDPLLPHGWIHDSTGGTGCDAPTSVRCIA